VRRAEKAIHGLGETTRAGKAVPVADEAALGRELIGVKLGAQLGNEPLAEGVRAPKFRLGPGMGNLDGHCGSRCG
jgi:hypothetical protein